MNDDSLLAHHVYPVTGLEYSIIIIIIYIAHTNIGTDTERKKSKGKRANHMILF